MRIYPCVYCNSTSAEIRVSPYKVVCRNCGLEGPNGLTVETGINSWNDLHAIVEEYIRGIDDGRI